MNDAPAGRDVPAGRECRPSGWAVSERLILTSLYVPGDRPDRFEKAIGAGADVVILDLEDAVAAHRKDYARKAVLDLLAEHPLLAENPLLAEYPRLSVRINGVQSPWHMADLEALADLDGLFSVRVPKISGAADVAAVVGGLGVGAPPLDCLLESALGVENAFAIASHPAVGSLALGEADLRSELRVTSDSALDWVRSRLVVASRAAGLPAPMMSVYTALEDADGLLASCRQGRAVGFIGRAAIHPRQLPVIRAGFRPSAHEVAEAQDLLAGLAEGERAGFGALVLPNGRMIDVAMAEGAQLVVALADRLT